MPIAFVNSASGTATSGTGPVAVTLNTTNANEVVVAVAYQRLLQDTFAVSGVTDSVSTKYSQRSSSIASAGASPTTAINVTEIWSGKAAAGNAANSVSVAFSGTLGVATRIAVCLAQYSGVLARGATVAASDTSGGPKGATSQTSSVTLEIQDPGNFLVAAIGSRSSTSSISAYVAGSGTIEVQAQAGIAGARIRNAIVDNSSATPFTNITDSVTLDTGAAWAATAYELKTAAPMQQTAKASGTEVSARLDAYPAGVKV